MRLSALLLQPSSASVQRYGPPNHTSSFSLFFTSLLPERPFFLLASRFSAGGDGLGFTLLPQPRVSFVHNRAGGFNPTQVRLGKVTARGVMHASGAVTDLARLV